MDRSDVGAMEHSPHSLVGHLATVQDEVLNFLRGSRLLFPDTRRRWAVEPTLRNQRLKQVVVDQFFVELEYGRHADVNDRLDSRRGQLPFAKARADFQFV